jgi:hypothetical protein
MNILVFFLIAAPLTIATMALLAHALDKLAEPDCSRRPDPREPRQHLNHIPSNSKL